MFNTILAAVDQSEAAACALQLAIAVARNDGSKLVLVSALDVAKLIAVSGYEAPYPVDAVAMLRESNEQFLADMKAECEKNGVNTETTLLEGDACDEILRAAQLYQAGLIVIGTHGRSGLSRLFLGSVCEGVLRRSNVPVLATRPSVSLETAADTARSANAPTTT